MEPWVKVILGIIIAVVLAIVMLVLNRPKKPTTTTVNTQPVQPSTPKAKKGYGWLWWVVAVVVVAFITWGFITSGGKSTAAGVGSGTQVVIPKEKWSFRWITPFKSQDLSVEIVENRNGVFRAVLHDINGHGNDERVAGLTLRWEGENLLGTWTDYADGEGGNAYLYKANNNLWSGWWECNNGKTKVHIEMKRE